MTTTKSKLLRRTAEHLGMPCIDGPSISKRDPKDIMGSPPVPAQDKWPELQALATTLADDVCSDINCLARNTIVKEPCAYPQQCILELLIAELQRRV